MLVHSQGVVYITPALENSPLLAALKQDFPSHWRDILLLLFYMYMTMSNGYLGLPPRKRRKEICGDYGLFEDVEDVVAFLDKESYRKMADRIMSVFFTDNQRNLESFRTKEEHFRTEMLKDDVSPKDYMEMSKALDHAAGMRLKYATEVEMEMGSEEELYKPHTLFELPVEQQPAYVKLKNV